MLPAGHLLQQRYRIVRHLGKGGMGTVYEATDERLGIPVALKHNHFDDERLAKQFEREAHILAKLRHQALPRVMDHFQEAGGQFLVMEFVGGADLAEAVKLRGTPFPTESVLRWTEQLLDALQYLHTQPSPIIHRDIKPQNLKLWAENQIVLLDFGLAKDVTLASRINTSGSIFGYTPNYAPLEQIQGSGTDPRSDLYSLAATFYHLVTGAPPPDVLTRVAATTDGGPDPLKPPNQVNDQVPAAVADVICRSLSIGRSARFASAADMRVAVRAAAAALAPVATPPVASTVAEPNGIAASTIALDPPFDSAVVGKVTLVSDDAASEPSAAGSGPDDAPAPTLSRGFGLRTAVVILAIAIATFGFFLPSGREAGMMFDVVAGGWDTSAAPPSAAEIAQTITILKARLQDLGFDDAEVGSGAAPNRISVVVHGVADREGLMASVFRGSRLSFAIVRAGPATDRQTFVPVGTGEPEHLMVVSSRSSDRVLGGGLYLVDRVPVITGEDIADASPAPDQANEPTILVRLTPDGLRKLSEAMKTNVGGRIAILLDDVIVTAPVIEGAITEPEVRIAGGFTRQEARDVVLLLRSGGLPTTLTVTAIYPLPAEPGYPVRRSALAASALLAGMAVFLFARQRRAERASALDHASMRVSPDR